MPNSPELIRSAQSELIRLGCLTGKPDGSLSAPTSAALGRYMKIEGQPSEKVSVTQTLVAELTKHTSRVCPIECKSGRDLEGRDLRRRREGQAAGHGVASQARRRGQAAPQAGQPHPSAKSRAGPEARAGSAARAAAGRRAAEHRERRRWRCPAGGSEHDQLALASEPLALYAVGLPSAPDRLIGANRGGLPVRRDAAANRGLFAQDQRWLLASQSRLGFWPHAVSATEMFGAGAQRATPESEPGLSGLARGAIYVRAPLATSHSY